jgi:cell division protein FtsL
MNNEEQQNNDERFTLVELPNGDIAVYDIDAAGHTCIFCPDDHPYANAAAEAERDRLNAGWRKGWEPYTISEGAGIIEVYNEKLEAVKAWFYRDVKAGVKALAEAQAERDRLNAEWRRTPFDN